jgi:general nucleoside transport system permease protein
MGPFDAAWLAAAIRLSVPLTYAASGELVAQRAGVLNLGLEGMMLAGALCGVLVAWSTGVFWLGVVGGLVGGVAVAAIVAGLSITLRADQIVVGVGINILMVGVTTFVFRRVLASRNVLLDRPDPVGIPLLEDIPFAGQALFHHTPLVYMAFASVLGAWFLLYRTRTGLIIRAAGETPSAADTAGHSVEGTRWLATLVAGAGAGLAGASLSIGSVGLFVENMTGGRGFLAVAAVIFGRWRPLGVLLGAFLFGAADALQLRLQAEGVVPRQVWLAIAVIALIFMATSLVRRRQLSKGTIAGSGVLIAVGLTLGITNPEMSLPAQVWLTAPAVLALVALASASKDSRVPSALTVPYQRSAAR